MRVRVSGHQVKTVDRAHKAFSALGHLRSTCKSESADI